MTVAVLFARGDSIYKTLSGTDVYDIERDARTWPGGCPVVAHPPCRAWGQLSFFARPRDDEKALAPWAIAQIRKYGGVLEHPSKSKLWPELGLPEPGKTDEFGGWTLPIHQNWFGHRAEKKTRLYIVGCKPSDIPEMPMTLAYATHVIGDSGRVALGNKRPEVSKAEREHTPPELAEWLVELARRCTSTAESTGTPCAGCGYVFDQDALGKYGCPNCLGDDLEQPDAAGRARRKCLPAQRGLL